MEGSVTYLAFNQDCTCLAVGTRGGFSIYGCDPFQLLYREEGSSISVVEMLYCTSLVAVVGSGDTPSSSCRQLTLYNTKERKAIMRMNFSTMITAVRMNQKRLVVLLSQKIHFFDLKSMHALHCIERIAHTSVDPALCALSSSLDRGVLATPTVSDPPAGLISLLDTHTLKPLGNTLAHHSPLKAICLNQSGTLLASASSKGTVIRVFSVPSLDRIATFRRGTVECSIYSLSFSRDNLFLTATGSSGTIHIFKAPDEALPPTPNGRDHTSTRPPMHRTSGGWTDTSSGGPTSYARPNGVHNGAAGSSSSSRASDDASGGPFFRPSPSPPPISSAHRHDRTDPSTSPLLSLASQATAASMASVASMASGVANAASTTFSTTLMNYLPASCRDLFDATRCFAWTKLKTPPDLPSIATVNYKAATGMYELVVACMSGCAYVYEWSADTGGECRLRAEHFLRSSLQSYDLFNSYRAANHSSSLPCSPPEHPTHTAEDEPPSAAHQPPSSPPQCPPSSAVPQQEQHQQQHAPPPAGDRSDSTSTSDHSSTDADLMAAGAAAEGIQGMQGKGGVT
ncbi:unnamed protein product [Vitrella brassicaformis CCMP3155]|uniref:Autophagy-related protein 18 n=1 Tax=Vitrella brassicaformis (strain CCMP3155) TaxID=1169540 RepID=A0A0G4EWM0_VITBC|nr:unnamed protein product [Vitrella brassicaformis CCMP3155]|eukprot:CEM02459.1 unnamed protein product [Vitrella brassicaformis CCMP3155]